MLCVYWDYSFNSIYIHQQKYKSNYANIMNWFYNEVIEGGVLWPTQKNALPKYDFVQIIIILCVNFYWTII